MAAVPPKLWTHAGMEEAKPVLAVGCDGEDAIAGLTTAISALATEVQGLRADIAAVTADDNGTKKLRTTDSGLL